MGRRQLSERRANALAQLFVLDLFVWVRARHVRYRIDPVAVTLLVITFKERLATFLTLAVDREVHDDTIQPGVEARFFLELLDIGEDLGKCFLGDFQRIFTVVEHTERNRNHLTLVAFYQFTRRLPVALFATPDQFPIARFHPSTYPNRRSVTSVYSAVLSPAGSPPPPERAQVLSPPLPQAGELRRKTGVYG